MPLIRLEDLIAYNEEKMVEDMLLKNRKRKERDDDEKTVRVKVDLSKYKRVKRINTEKSEKEEKVENKKEIKYDKEQLETIKELFSMEYPWKDEKPKKINKKMTYLRDCSNPLFDNVTHDQAEKLVQKMNQGDAIFRPSTKDCEHLVVTWKVTDDITQHVQIREESKPNVYTIGHKLRIDNEEFKDIDEIMTRYIKPIAAYASELIQYKRFQPHVLGIKEKAEEILKRQKKQNPEYIPYIISASKKYPGSFLISYLPKNTFYHEYISISPAGYRLRSNDFTNLGDLLVWFKEHSKEPKPKAHSNKYDVNKNVVRDLMQRIKNSIKVPRQESNNLLTSDAVSNTTTEN